MISGDTLNSEATRITFFRLCMLSVRLVNIILLARIVDVQTYGLLIVLITTLTVLSELSNIGLTSYLQRESHSQTNNSTEIAIYLTRRSSSLYLIIVTIPILVFGQSNNLDKIIILTTPIFLIIERNFELFVIHFIAIRETQVIQYAVGSSSAISSLFLILHFSKYDIGVNSYFWIRLIASLPLAFAVSRIPYKKISLGKNSTITSALRSFGVLNTANTLRTLDIVFVGFFADSLQVGLYSVASKLILPFLILVTLMSPYFAKFCAKKNYAQINQIRRNLGFLLVFLMTIFLILSFFASFIINQIYGETFAQASKILSVMFMVAPFFIVNPLFAILAISEGNESSMVMATVRNTLVLMLFVSMGSFFAGALGAAFGLLITSILRTRYLAFVK